MSVEAPQGRGNCKVVCAWCGVIIRRNSAKEATGMCLDCHSRLLGEYYRHGYRAGTTGKASQR